MKPNPRLTGKTLCVAIAVCAFVWAWLASGSWLASGLNWDTASYVALYASGQGSPAQLPWNSHYGLGPVYGAAGWIARLCGGTWIDGVRFMNALALATAALIMARFGLGAAGFAGALWSLLYVFSWGVAQLLLTLEDNVLYLPFVVALLTLALRHTLDWRARHSVYAGVLGACGVLISWQAGLYLFPPLYVAVTCGERSWRLRLRDVVLLLGTMLMALVGFVLLFGIMARDGLRVLFSTLLRRPSPSFFPSGLGDFGALWLQRKRVLAQLAGGLIGQLGPLALRPAWLWAFGLAIVCTMAIGLFWAWQRRPHAAAMIWAVSFAAVTGGTALYLDLPADAYKRYEFIPLFVTAGVVLMTAGMHAHRRQRLMGGVAALCALASLCLGVVQARAYRLRLARMQPLYYYGWKVEPWFVYLRGLREAHPNACLFTLPLDPALLHGRYQLEIPAALWSELPAHQLVGDPRLVQGWPRRVNVVSPDHLRPPLPCEWRQTTL